MSPLINPDGARAVSIVIPPILYEIFDRKIDRSIVYIKYFSEILQRFSNDDSSLPCFSYQVLSLKHSVLQMYKRLVWYWLEVKKIETQDNVECEKSMEL